ncbi:transcription termination/antitermination NusG family protein [Flavobacterium sp. CS20]|jgi:transcription antitermination factor NusG|uniref:transcription termination/antitermination NusG family protein n=1 Tax=Flavobacterium sp. CS20 TaxID=2775246 RepID=UPI001B39DCF2|nr:transcription termination/antitermination NusG family protein [Flavobacterium sp. CS20]QTY26677.1 UpxY family transcription antiterminator [Flavobacterium sp. CS20]
MAQSKPQYIKANPKVSSSKHWFVIYCKPNTEKKTAQHLSEIGIKNYCPTQTVVRQWSDRKKKINIPVLPSMVLVYINEKERNSVFQVTTVMRYLFWLNQPAKVTETEIDNLKKALSSNYKGIDIKQISPNSSEVKLKGFGIEEKDGQIKYKTKSHYYIYLNRLGYLIKVKR